MSNRLDNTRKVTFQEDYTTRSGKLLHEKGETAKAREKFLEQQEKDSKKK